MNKLDSLTRLRNKLLSGGHSVGSWMQIPHPSIAEILGGVGYDWVAVDMEHGSIDVSQLPDIFRALELGNTLPLARIAQDNPKDCKQVLDAGAAGVVIPMIESAEQLMRVRDACRWPPSGRRGVGFSRGNLFGKRFQDYQEEAQSPFLVAMIEHVSAVESLDEILNVEGLDAVLIGPYDLSASLGLTAKFDHKDFLATMERIRVSAESASVPVGIHVIEPSESQVRERIDEGYRFIAYSIDAVMLESAAHYEGG